MAASTTDLSIDFSRATASAICRSSSLLALTAASAMSLSPVVQIGCLFVAVFDVSGPLAAIAHRRARAARFRRLDQRIGQDELRFADIGERDADQKPLGSPFRVVDEEAHLAIGK